MHLNVENHLVIVVHKKYLQHFQLKLIDNKLNLKNILHKNHLNFNLKNLLEE